MDLPRLIIKEKKCCDVTEPIEIDKDRLVFIETRKLSDNPYVETRTEGAFRGNAICLDNQYDWILGKDDADSIIVVPLRRQK